MKVEEYIIFAKDVFDTTIALFQLIPADKISWKPVEKSFTLGQQMNHICDGLKFNADALAFNKWSFSSLKEIFIANRTLKEVSVEEGIEKFKINSKYFINSISTLSDLDFSENYLETLQWGKILKWRYGLFILEHHLNHKAQIFDSLKLLNVPINSANLYGRERK